jgi:hypothetical protein
MALDAHILTEQFQHGAVGPLDIGGIAAERDPGKGSLRWQNSGWMKAGTKPG